MNSDLKSKVEAAINDIRPFLVADGGNIELIDIKEGKIARVKLLGACSNCSMSPMTMKAGVEESIRKAVPEIVSVEAVNETVVV